MKVFKIEKIVLFNTKIDPKPKVVQKTIFKPKKIFCSHIQEEKPELKPKKYHFLGKKKYRFQVEKTAEKSVNEGRWNLKEQLQFFEAIDKCGMNWKKISNLMPTRTSSQIRAHAQKFFKKIKKFKDEKMGIDLTPDSILNIKDVISHIKSVNSDYSIFNIFCIIAGVNNKKIEEKENKVENKENINDDKIVYEKINIYNINNIYNNCDIYDKENKENKESNCNPQKKNDENNNIATNNNFNKIPNDIVPIYKVPINNHLMTNNNQIKNINYVETRNYAYLIRSIVINIIKIIYQNNRNTLDIYLHSLKDYFNIDVQNNEDSINNDYANYIKKYY